MIRKDQEDLIFHLISRHEQRHRLDVHHPSDALVVRLGTRVEREHDVDRLLRLFEHHDGHRALIVLGEDRRVDEVHDVRMRALGVELAEIWGS